MNFGILVVLRLAVVAFSLLTCAYAVLNCSPFAFDMFIRPQLFPWLGRFVAWHHVWFTVAYLASVLTLLPELTRSSARDRSGRSAHLLAIGYTTLFGLASLLLIAQPYLPTLWNDGRALPTALAALLPLLILAAVDHLSASSSWTAADRGMAGVLSQRRLLTTCGGTAVYLWLVHLSRGLVQRDLSGGIAVWILTCVRTLTLVAAFFAFVYALLALIAAIAARTRRPRTSEYVLTVLLAAAGICEFFRRAVFPTISMSPAASGIIAAAVGITLAATWSGLAARRPLSRTRRHWSAGDLLLAPALGRTWTVVGLCAIPAVAFYALNAMERIDWSFGARRTILVCETLLVFGLMLRATERLRDAGVWSMRRTVLPPLAALAAFLVLPHAASVLAASTGNRNLEPSVAFQRHAAAEDGFAVLADALVARPGFDADYYRVLLAHADASGIVPITVPDIDFSPTSARGARRSRPDIFVFVIDSLRRDYLSTYNPAVAFTPNFDRFGAENFAFTNAFTRHGGTELAMPSIWAGAAVVRKVRANHFERMNAMEKLVNADGYRIAINDFTVADHLRNTTPVTTLDEGVKSVDTDLCQNLASLEAYLDASAADSRPVFGYFAPMNVHILNTQRGGQSSLDGTYPGFYAPYASRLKRIDACFGKFVAYLKERGRYDDSIIVVTSDHGDSLGENGYWGHAMWLFPEDVRVPLIMRVPASLRPQVTTDLARITFSTDIAPTLYALLGYLVCKPGPVFGEPLFVPASQVLADRRREPFLLTSSYGATYGLLRRNGRLLYVSDLVEWRESAYDLSKRALGEALHVDSWVRQVNQREIRKQVGDLARFYSSPE